MQTASLPRLMMLLAGLSLAACGDDSDPIKPPENPAPTGLQATATGTNTIQVSWSAPTTPATEFVLHRATGDGDFAEIARPGATATSHADAGLQPGTAYRYRIAAVRSAGTSSFSAIASATTEEEVEDLIVEVTTNITTDTRWTADRTYYLMGFIKVANGATLTIDPGTTIYGDYETLGSSLFVLRGARIVANGTADNPIVFTSERPVGQRRPGDWGGLIVVGNGIINRSGTVIVEGTATDDVINPAVPYSGGTDNTDNSGTLRYVRVEYAGYAPAQDAELNSFTFAAVGSGTTMEYLQAHNGLDDAFEWFGGAVDGRYLVSYETGDDHFDMSEGYSGRLQYLIAYQSKLLDPRPNAGGVASDPQGFEIDGCGSNAGGGCDNGYNSTPFTSPVVANFTMIGSAAGLVGSSGGYGMVLRRGTAGHYVNGIIAHWPTAAIGYRDAQSKARELDGLLTIQGLYVAETATLFQSGQQQYEGPGEIEHQPATAAATIFSSLPANPANAAEFDWSLAPGVAPRTGGLVIFTGNLAARAGGAIGGTTFRGAADPNGPKWWQGWTTYTDN